MRAKNHLHLEIPMHYSVQADTGPYKVGQFTFNHPIRSGHRRYITTHCRSIVVSRAQVMGKPRSAPSKRCLARVLTNNRGGASLYMRTGTYLV